MRELQPGQIVSVSQSGEAITFHVEVIDTLDTARTRVRSCGQARLELIGRQWPSARIAWLREGGIRLMFPVIQVSEGGEIRFLDTELSSIDVRVLQSRPENN